MKGSSGAKLPLDDFLSYVVSYLFLFTTWDYSVSEGRRSRRQLESLRSFLTGLWQGRNQLKEEHYCAGEIGGYCRLHHCMWLNTRRFKDLFRGTKAEVGVKKFGDLYSGGHPLYSASILLPGYLRKKGWRGKTLETAVGQVTDAGFRELCRSVNCDGRGLSFDWDVVVTFVTGQRTLWIGAPTDAELAAIDQAARAPGAASEIPDWRKKLSPRDDPTVRFRLFKECWETGERDRVRRKSLLPATSEQRAGAPTPEQLENVTEATRRACSDAAFEALRGRLCWPFEARKLLEEEGRPWQVAAREGLPGFELLPPSICSRPATRADWTEPEKWPEMDLGEAVDEILLPRDKPWRVLVEAPAGFGKTTLLLDLCGALAKPPGQFAFEPVRMGDWEPAGENLSVGGLARLLAPQLRVHWDWPDELRVRTAELLLRSGKAVALVDGLDQVTGGFKAMEGLLKSDCSNLKLVAACRQELGKGERTELFDAVLRLRGLHLDLVPCDVLSQRVRLVLSEIQNIAAVHPFWVHVARVLERRGALPSRERASGLVGEYLNQLLDLAAEHEGLEEESTEKLTLDDELMTVVGAIALDSLRYCLAGEVPTLGVIPEEMFRSSLSKLGSRHLSHGLVRTLRHAQEGGALLNPLLPERSRGTRGTVRVFQHQLLQEYLAAVGAAEELAGKVKACSHSEEREQRLLEGLLEISSQVLNPVDPHSTASGDPEQSERGEALLFWSFLGEVLAGGCRALAKDDITSLVKALTLEMRDRLVQEHEDARGSVDELRDKARALLSSPVACDQSGLELLDAVAKGMWSVIDNDARSVCRLPGDVEGSTNSLSVLTDLITVGPRVLSVGEFATLFERVVARLKAREREQGFRDTLLRVRDELCEARAHRSSRERPWMQEGELVEDPFLAGAWAAERVLIAASQPDDDHVRQIEERLREEEPTGGWSVHREGHLVVATDCDGARWLHVPAGPFVSGTWENGLFPVGLKTTGSYLIAQDPVLVEDFRKFVSSGYDLDETWWRPFRDQAEQTLDRRQRERGGPSWVEPDGDSPVNGILWYEAAAYCNWLCRPGGSETAMSLYRLPTEAEWEKAIRGVLGRRWPWGCAWQPIIQFLEEKGWHRDCFEKRFVSCSPFGLRWMLGPTMEWTGDRRSSDGTEGADKAKARLSFLQGVHGCGMPYEKDAGRVGWQAGFRCVRSIEQGRSPSHHDADLAGEAL